MTLFKITTHNTANLEPELQGSNSKPQPKPKSWRVKAAGSWPHSTMSRGYSGWWVEGCFPFILAVFPLIFLHGQVVLGETRSYRQEVSYYFTRGLALRDLLILGNNFSVFNLNLFGNIFPYLVSWSAEQLFYWGPLYLWKCSISKLGTKIYF